jgi:hypothetical protein
VKDVGDKRKPHVQSSRTERTGMGDGGLFLLQLGQRREEAGSGRREQTVQNSKEDRSQAHPELLLAGNVAWL